MHKKEKTENEILIEIINAQQKIIETLKELTKLLKDERRSEWQIC